MLLRYLRNFNERRLQSEQPDSHSDHRAVARVAVKHGSL